jgi:hypothetical protein
MHEYLTPGLEFLFRGKKGIVDVVVANNSVSSSVGMSVQTMLHSIARQMTPKGSAFEGSITPRQSFQEFIEKEMD